MEKSISKYELEYADLISQAQTIKTDLVTMQNKVERSIALLNSLSSEKIRWELNISKFKIQMCTLVGDCLLSSGLLAYLGFYDQNTRNSLFTNWKLILKKYNINFKQDLARFEYLSTPDERLIWNNMNSLPDDDDLCIENAVILKRFNRFPLVIDPSDQATWFILKMFHDRKIVRTSFLDKSFRKHLESALRFGNPILIRDAENYDSILNPVLNRDVRKNNGRVLVSIGDLDIDYSPMFTMFLMTRDSNFQFSSEISSRVTFVNFTVTRSSLKVQCLNRLLKFEQPGICEKKKNLTKTQGEFQQRLRHLEKDLLNSLNESKLNLLNDDLVITRLENLKKESNELNNKIKDTFQIINEIETITNQYTQLSQVCCDIYFLMTDLNKIHFLYHYSLNYFFDIYDEVLTKNYNSYDIVDSSKRLKIIIKDIFFTAFKRLSLGMLYSDKMVLALLFAKVYIKRQHNR